MMMMRFSSPSLLLRTSPVGMLLMLLHHMVHCQESPCNTFNNCFDCIDASCSWVEGLQDCLEDCSMIADIPCYDMALYPDDRFDTTEAVCQAISIQSQNDALCEDQSSSCSDCVTTQLLDGSINDAGSGCQWFQDGNYCANGCGMMGCGVTECDAVEPPSCDGNNCLDCLNSGPSSCGWAGTGAGCLPSCDDISDIPCYGANTLPNSSIEDICDAATIDIDNFNLCSSQLNCNDCVTTTLPGGTARTCNWLAELNICQSGCGQFGCGDTTCADIAVEECNGGTCLDCLNSGPACGWAGEEAGCLSSCDDIAGIACYDISDTLPTAEEVCVTVTEADDGTSCLSKENCGDCVGTVLSNGSRCNWLEEYGICQNGCGALGCGTLVCNQDTTNQGGTCGGDTCFDCLSSGPTCGWANGAECLPSCDDIADAPCYDSNTLPDSSIDEVCNMAAIDEENAALCSLQDNCGDCVATTLINDGDSCNWLGEYNICQSGCGQLGCGRFTCDECLGENCLGCLNSGTDCGWTGGGAGCLPSCDIIADAPCYERGTIPDNTAEEICDIANTNERKSSICSSQESCSDCAGISFQDGSTCYWLGGEFNICQGVECSQLGCGSLTCDECSGESCLDCLISEPSCGWAGGAGCLSSCDVIADAPCYDINTLPDSTTEEICQAATTNEENAALCSSQLSCGDCVATTLSDGSTCNWLADNNLCQSGCGQLGCGSSTCDDECSGDNCLGCLNSGPSCGWVGGSECLESCYIIADISCYDSTTIPDSTTDEICDAANTSEENDALCSSQESCDDCVGTSLQGGTTCNWLAEFNVCQSDACSQIGCGDTTCDVPQECSGVNCLECLNSGPSCGWVGGSECLESCDIIADASCYSSSTIPGSSTLEICEAAITNEENAALCSSKETCGDCVATTLSGGSTCNWFADNNVCQSGCGQLGCGDFTCNIEQDCNEDNCLECLNSGPTCGWAGGAGCLPSCDVIADAPCYDSGTLENSSTGETCDYAASEAENAALCSSQENCGNCVSTILPDGDSCNWLAEYNLCQSGCGQLGCGSSSCEATDCDTLDDCVQCLDSGSCAWSPEAGCLSSCDVIADTSCFAASDYTIDDVCVLADDPPTFADSDISDVPPTSFSGNETINATDTTFATNNTTSTIDVNATTANNTNITNDIFSSANKIKPLVGIMGCFLGALAVPMFIF